MLNDIVHVERRLVSPLPIEQLDIDGLFHENIGINDKVAEIDMLAWSAISKEIRKKSVDDRE
ncbi:hypothetical protein KBC75_03805, partial [Candidatus Shapirobacteria bacterium]|nr:hypothetical protein [Candidatus Shapirobacteria bacterium]